MAVYKIATVDLRQGNAPQITYDGVHTGILLNGEWLVLVQGTTQVLLELSEGWAMIYGITLDHD